MELLIVLIAALIFAGLFFIVQAIRPKDERGDGPGGGPGGDNNYH